MTTAPKLVLVLSENWTLTPPRDLRALVEMAVVAEEAGFDAVMVSEHVVLGPSAGADGIMGNPRDYAMPGNQDPAMPWPSSLVLLSAIAAATTRLRLAACAVIAPLRHPLLLARELGTLDILSEGRLVVQPTVSWHREEYEALGVPFEKRGALLDEHLAAWEGLWRDTPATFRGVHYAYEDVYLEPKAWRPDGPRLWLGGESVHPRLLRRIVRYAHGFHPLGQPSEEDMTRLRDGLAAAGRDLSELELVGGMRAVFPDDASPSPLEPAIASIPAMAARGFGTFCIKPSQFVDDIARYPAWCREVVERVAEVAIPCVESPQKPVGGRLEVPVLQQVTITPEEHAARRGRFPVGAAIEFADLEEAGREEALDRLREAEPVSWVPALGGWLVTGHAEARQLLSPRSGATVEAEENLVRASLGPMMLTTDGDEHTRLRAPFERPFRMREVGELFGAVASDEADRLLAGIAPSGRCELGAAFAAPFAVRMTGKVLGLSLDDVSRIDGFYSAFAGAMVYDGNPEPQRLADAAREELDAILHADLARCRRDPDASITAEVANDPAPGVSDDEAVAQLRVIMFGGIETIQAAIMNTLLLLLRSPEQLGAVRADGALLAGAVEESLRLIPPVAFIERWTSGPVTIGGVELGPGEFLGASVLAANRDPAVFPEPLRYDVRRDNARRHLAFSFGEHFCLGAHLARLEVTEALSRLLVHLPGLRLLACDEPSGFAFRRPARLELAWGEG